MPTLTGSLHSAPLLGPSLGPILGGVLTEAFDWRATFWFIAIFSGSCFLLFIPFKDTYRRERSLTYQNALKRRRAIMLAKGSESSSMTQVAAISRAVSQTPESTFRPSPGDAQKDTVETLSRQRDLEMQQMPKASMDDVELTLADVNPAKPLWYVLRRMNNLGIMVSAGESPNSVFLCVITLLTHVDSRSALNLHHKG